MSVTKGNGSVPPRAPTRHPKYPWADLDVSDYATLPSTFDARQKAAALSSAYNFAKRHQWKLVRRDQPDGSTRVYREA